MKRQPWARTRTSKPAPYDAFISYSHGVDSRLGPALRDALHQFARPWYRLRALRVFCDERSLSASPGLWSTIEAALAVSRCFILLASATSAGSRWVQREVEQWQRTEPKRPFFIVLSDGEIAWDRTAADFDWDRTTALPKSLSRWFMEEPLWVDLRHARKEEDLSRNNPVFLDGVATLAAPLHGRAKDELIGEDVRQHHRAKRFRRFSWAGLSILTVLAVLAATVAVSQRNEATVQRNEAMAQRNEATVQRDRAETRLMVAQAEALRPARPEVSALMTVAAWRRADNPETRSALLGTQGHRRAGALLGHTNDVYGIAVSPDGTLLASTGQDHSVRLWNLGERRQLPPLDPGNHNGFSSSPMFSADGSVLATGAYDGTVWLWDLAARRPLTPPIPVDTGSQTRRLVVMALSPDGSTLAVATQRGTVRLWDVATGQPIAEAFRGHTQAMVGMAFSPNGAILATADDTTVRLWDVSSRAQLGDGVQAAAPRPPGGPGLAFRPDGAVLAVADVDRVLLVGVASHSIIGQPLQTSHQIRAVAFNPDGTVLATAGTDGAVRLWNTVAGRELDEPLTGHGGSVWSVAFSPDGRTLAASAPGGRLLLWEVDGAILGRHASSVDAIAFTADGNVLASIGVDGSVRLWDVQKHQPVSTPREMPTIRVLHIYQRPPDPGTRAVFSLDGRLLAISGAGGGVWLWDITGPGLPTELTSTRFGVPPRMAFNPDGKVLATTDVDKVRLWEVRTRQTIGTIVGYPGTIFGLAFSPDGRTLVTGSFDVQMWDVATLQRLGPALLPQGGGDTTFTNAVAVSPDGTVLATANADWTVRLWRLPNGEPLGGPLVGHGDEVVEVTFAADANTLVTTSNDGTVRFWDTSEGTELWSISGLSDQQSAAVSPRPGLLATGDVDGRVVLWSTDLDRVAADICGLGGDPMTQQEWQTFLPALSYQMVCP